MSLIKLIKNLMRCHLFHKKIGLKIVSTFKFNLFFTLLLQCAEALITNSVIFLILVLISNKFTHAVEYMILTSHHLPVQTHYSNLRSTLSNFFGEFEEILSKLHSIILTLLQWIWPLSVGAKSFCDIHKMQISFTLLLS